MVKALLMLLVLINCFIFFAGCSLTQNNQAQEYLRIHIRANSNLSVDQNIKYLVKDEVVKYLTPIVANSQTFNAVKSNLEINLNNIKSVIDSVLKENGFNYLSQVKLHNEFFPTRYYEDKLLEANYYDALIIELGQAVGDNWWCVVYPPLCFVGNTQTYGENFKYKSKLVEIINNFFGN